MDKKTKERYFDYILMYVNFILELGDELEDKCRKKRLGDVVFKRKKYRYFAISNGVTIVDKKTSLELSFSFNKEKTYIYFEKDNLHNFIESDLNVSGLGKNFPSNKIIRLELYNECLDEIVHSGKIQKKDNGFTISKKEIYLKK